MTDKQTAHFRCHCGRNARVTPTHSVFEFDYVCECGNRGVISWSHQHQPPRYIGEEQQPSLFREEREE